MELIIANVQIRQDDDGRYCLNDFHKAAGANGKDAPSHWLKTQQSKELAQELSDAGIPVSVIKGGLMQGTYVCKELVYAYAMWISAKFHLEVIRAYDRLATDGVAVHKDAAEDLLENPMKYIEALMGQAKKLKAERDLAIATKAEIGSRREATAMATASAQARRASMLAAELGRNGRQATVIAVEKATGKKMDSQAFRPLQRWCKEHSFKAAEVPDPRYGKVKAWPAAAWKEVYDIDLPSLFPMPANDIHTAVSA